MKKEVQKKQGRIKLKAIALIVLSLLVFNNTMNAQDRKTRWKSSAPTQPDLSLFHSIDVVNLPTAETLQKGDFHFEISHRFNTPVSAGWGEVFGFDGSVSMRLAMGYAFTNDLLFTLGRSNRDGNIDYRFKYKAFQIRSDVLPTLISVRVGGAYNGKAINIDNGDKHQFYGQLIVNTLYNKKLGIGFVPSYLYNSHIYCLDTQDSFTFGMYAQYYVSEGWNVFLEFNPTVTGWRNKYNSMAFGVELETGGHFFKILFGNNTKLNPSQYLAGAVHEINSNDWHIGFNITRLLKF
jgi:uncharacterized beta barrel domain-containing protein DUF5777